MGTENLPCECRALGPGVPSAVSPGALAGSWAARRAIGTGAGAVVLAGSMLSSARSACSQRPGPPHPCPPYSPVPVSGLALSIAASCTSGCCVAGALGSSLVSILRGGPCSIRGGWSPRASSSACVACSRPFRGSLTESLKVGAQSIWSLAGPTGGPGGVKLCGQGKGLGPDRPLGQVTCE